jgi:hypothetical protein
MNLRRSLVLAVVLVAMLGGRDPGAAHEKRAGVFALEGDQLTIVDNAADLARLRPPSLRDRVTARIL